MTRAQPSISTARSVCAPATRPVTSSASPARNRSQTCRATQPGRLVSGAGGHRAARGDSARAGGVFRFGRRRAAAAAGPEAWLRQGESASRASVAGRETPCAIDCCAGVARMPRAPIRQRLPISLTILRTMRPTHSDVSLIGPARIARAEDSEATNNCSLQRMRQCSGAAWTQTRELKDLMQQCFARLLLFARHALHRTLRVRFRATNT